MNFIRDVARYSVKAEDTVKIQRLGENENNKNNNDNKKERI